MRMRNIFLWITLVNAAYAVDSHLLNLDLLGCIGVLILILVTPLSLMDSQISFLILHGLRTSFMFLCDF
jgi:hypothetical protein